MPGNLFGQAFRVSTFGESHGPLVGAVVDGCPAGLELDLDFIQAQMSKRKPGQSRITTQRKEADEVQIVAGVYEGRTTGTPIAALIDNKDNRAKDYDHLKNAFRPSHADFTYQAKYGHRDHRGGGRGSARETAARVFAGAVAQLLLQKSGISVFAFVSQVGSLMCPRRYDELDLSRTFDHPTRCPDPATADEMMKMIEDVRKQGDTIGGVVTGVVRGCPAGLGEPVFDRLHADLGKAMLSINACKGFEIGSGFDGVRMRGSQHNDPFQNVGGRILTTTNNSGGIQGGISNGMDIYFRVAFKPVATLMKKQKSVNSSGQPCEVEGKGRHDPCVVPRAVAIVEGMAAITVADHLLRNRKSRL
ncbi:MAG: chorismate synthase [Bdellovibrio sp.]|nr:MAG: chorismate synthase [Bdellovibrio sp.]